MRRVDRELRTEDRDAQLVSERLQRLSLRKPPREEQMQNLYAKNDVPKESLNAAWLEKLRKSTKI